MRKYKSFNPKNYINLMKRRLQFFKRNKLDQEMLEEINKEFVEKN